MIATQRVDSEFTIARSTPTEKPPWLPSHVGAQWLESFGIPLACPAEASSGGSFGFWDYTNDLPQSLLGSWILFQRLQLPSKVVGKKVEAKKPNDPPDNPQVD